MLSIGIRLEGPNDIETVKILLNRIAGDVGIKIEILDENIFPSGGSIEPHLLLTAKVFLRKNIDIGVYIGDQDKKEKNAKSKFDSILKKESEVYSQMSVVAVANRNLEAWLVADQNNFKKQLKISDSTAPLVSLDDPKECLHVYTSLQPPSEDNPGVKEVMHILSSTLNLSIVKRNSKDFRKFYEEFSKMLKLKNKNSFSK